MSFEGEHYTISLMTPFFAPGPIEWPRIPIYIAAVNPYMCRLAGELCDGIHVHPFHSIKYLRETLLPNIEAGLAKSGRTRGDLTLATLGLRDHRADRATTSSAPRIPPGRRSPSTPRRGPTAACSRRTAGARPATA